MSALAKSEQIGQLVAALAKAHASFEAVTKDRKANIQSAKGSYSYKYATLADVFEAVEGPLAANGLALMQFPATAERGVVVVTMLAHASGEWIQDSLEMPVAANDARAVASAITYARRYAAMAILGIAPEDDDGEAATQGRQAPAAANGNGRAAPPAPAPQAAATNGAGDVLAAVARFREQIEKCGRDGTRKDLNTIVAEITRSKLPQDARDRLTQSYRDAVAACDARAAEQAEAERALGGQPS